MYQSSVFGSAPAPAGGCTCSESLSRASRILISSGKSPFCDGERNSLASGRGSRLDFFSGGLLFLEAAARAIFFVTLLQPIRRRQGEQLRQVFQQVLLEFLGGLLRICVRASERFGNDFVHELELQQVARGDL